MPWDKVMIVPDESPGKKPPKAKRVLTEWDFERKPNLRTSPLAKHGYPRRAAALRVVKTDDCGQCHRPGESWDLVIFEARNTSNKSAGMVYRKMTTERMQSIVRRPVHKHREQVLTEARHYCERFGIHFEEVGHWREAVKQGDSADAIEDARRTMFRRANEQVTNPNRTVNK